MTALDIRQGGHLSQHDQTTSSRLPRLKEFLVQWSATVQAESAKSAVRRLWASHFKLSEHDRFSVYCGQTRKSYHYRANTLAPELNKETLGSHVYRVTWKATVLAEDEGAALRLAYERLLTRREEQAPRVTLGIHDRRGSCLKTERSGLHDIVRLVKSSPSHH